MTVGSDAQVVIRMQRRRIWWAFPVLVLILAAAVGELATGGAASTAVGVVMSIVFVTFFGVIAWLMVSPQTLSIDRDGWTLRSLWMSRSVRWKDVVDLGQVTYRGLFIRQRRVAFHLRHPEASSGAQQVARRMYRGFDGTLPVTLGDADEVLVVLREQYTLAQTD